MLYDQQLQQEGEFGALARFFETKEVDGFERFNPVIDESCILNHVFATEDGGIIVNSLREPIVQDGASCRISRTITSYQFIEDAREIEWTMLWWLKLKKFLRGRIEDLKLGTKIRENLCSPNEVLTSKVNVFMSYNYAYNNPLMYPILW
ncbi:hypothetical protein PHYBLDRAFT_184550 [Phycomyces blakesleeanus NRRL 1555(-)]|uniref:Uncharacterized protein n=1 Tax=Phycomyces blakesleeanus (strain ATCC 8743b / DSM 1359 / FGSC 10004 / NBRC 33097 / NRRL 1555) TaxID=763407 RepID=A0A163BEM1_PHYB8|nr:hypothetical protein PHYBLDRAFT_184550 [Phycomyces blakesleeanus NRRL 1555(-)]OAD81101.1 hypothetical protein PHYBLDRAFT_184550 [Phycomyces blakesleeanus NRRL 1555(-)]|eukprot:XP_018299141.1 hypothetical protein PHYBLDRAFT_184550 [Phycomyces blakesleeanus NRRL 1555(-)]